MAAVYFVYDCRDMRKYRPLLKYQKRRARDKPRLVVARVALGGKHSLWDIFLCMTTLFQSCISNVVEMTGSLSLD